jgi:hypothetical protein
VTIAVIAIVGLVVARNRRRDEVKAVGVLGVSKGAVAIIALGCFMLGHVWFDQASLAEWDGSAEFTGQLPVVVADSWATITPAGPP